MCGERPASDSSPFAPAGSSPRVRGTRALRRAAARPQRFIPACAGNAARRSTPSAGRRVHPRVCGERPEPAAVETYAVGSSPRVRGTHTGRRPGRSAGRFIPACAGNARAARRDTPPPPVHPRVCGERQLHACAAAVGDGSSPRVRGTRFRRGHHDQQQRFIPACAGNASCPRAPATRPAVHPRVCGERRTAASALGSSTGSSPRVRGTRAIRKTRAAASRFIPACAGNAASRILMAVAQPVHPRVCGERAFLAFAASCSSGSSPRVRGTLQTSLPGSRGPRFIPACAGNAV